MADSVPLQSPVWKQLTSPLAVAFILATFWVAINASLRNKSLTMDESGHVMSGYTFWKYNDYRLDPENGNLPQRVMALPLVLGDFSPPLIRSLQWRSGDVDSLSHYWLYTTAGNDVTAMAWRGRAAAALFAVALGAVTWFWARRLFGPAGGMLSLLLYVLSPTILANGALMTSDTAGALFLVGSTWSLWALLHRLSLGRIMVSALVMGGLFVSKLSAVLIVPIAAVLVIARLMSGRPLPVEIYGGRLLVRRGQQALALAAAAIFHAIVVFSVIWAAYGFRYAAFNQTPPADQQATFPKWAAILDPVDAMDKPLPRPFVQTINLLRSHHVLPEAYLYGCARFLKTSGARYAFLNGQFGLFGWKSFFPYTFLVKTPLTVFAIMGLALAAGVRSWRRSRQGLALPAQNGATLYETLPLWTLLAVYWASVIPSHLNIGHRHILATYPPLFVLCGMAAAWFERPKAGDTATLSSRRAVRGVGAALAVLVAVLAMEVLYRFPNYLAYFNGLVSPARAYRHLVDSSLDWGQDLPGVKTYIESHRLEGQAYLSYFGQAYRDYYKIPAAYLYSDLVVGDEYQAVRLRPVPAESVHASATIASPFPDYDFISTVSNDGGSYEFLIKKPSELRLMPGTYFISATMLQPVTYDFIKGPWGPWNSYYEEHYRWLCDTVRPLLGDDIAARNAALTARPPKAWIPLLSDFEIFRFARLTAYLRRFREPDDTVNFSILIYHLSAADLARALGGPPPELGPDLPFVLVPRISKLEP